MQLKAEKPKYLIFDHGGVLDGEYSETFDADDLVLEIYGANQYQVLKHGVSIVRNLQELVTKYGYQIAFHSKNKEADQINILEQLHVACGAKSNLQQSFPSIAGMVVCDANRFKDVTASSPTIIENAEYHIPIAGYGIEDNNDKSDVRTALSVLLNIPQEERGNHIVFDDGSSIVETAKKEGYRAYKIDIGDPDKTKVLLHQAIEEILTLERQKAAPQPVLLDKVANKVSEVSIEQQLAEYTSGWNLFIALLKSIFSFGLALEKQKIARGLKYGLDVLKKPNPDNAPRLSRQEMIRNSSEANTIAVIKEHQSSCVFSENYGKTNPDTKETQYDWGRLGTILGNNK
jgi:hypothetical protein